MPNPQANSRHCFVCGVSNPFGLKLRFYETAPGEVSAETVIGEQYQGFPGVVHGGIVSAMLDEIAARALIGSDPPRFMYTARLEIRYRGNVPVGRRLHLHGKVVKSKSRSAIASSAIYDEDGTLLAEAEGLFVEIPAEMIQDADLEALGWRIYSDEELAKHHSL